jgi:soluble lytic murein transglycosylase-like protein
MTKKKSTSTRRKTPQSKKTPRKRSASRQRSVQKPQMKIKTGEAARQARAEQASRPLTVWGVVIRFLPVWVLILMILILAPALPLRAVQGIAGWVGGLFPGAGTAESVEPVFIVEDAESRPLDRELPTPSWSLEIASVFTPEVRAWEDEIGVWSTAYRIKPNLIATLMQIESCGNPEIVSPAGATGLFQVTPIHFEEGEDPLDPDTNARRGLTYFADMYARANGDLGLALAAYNAGPSVLTLSPAEWPAETQSYQFWGSGIYEEAELGLDQSPTLQDWLEAGGAALCEQAAEALGGE